MASAATEIEPLDLTFAGTSAAIFGSAATLAVVPVAGAELLPEELELELLLEPQPATTNAAPRRTASQ